MCLLLEFIHLILAIVLDNDFDLRRCDLDLPRRQDRTSIILGVVVSAQTPRRLKTVLVVSYPGCHLADKTRERPVKPRARNVVVVKKAKAKSLDAAWRISPLR
jgi:hypothetical protein